MRNRLITAILPLTRTLQAPNSFHLGRHRWIVQFPMEADRLIHTILPNTTQRRFVTTEDTKSEVEGQLEYASADDTDDTTPTTDRDTDIASNEQKPGSDSNSYPPVLRVSQGERITSHEPRWIRRTKKLRKSQISTLEDVKARLNDWLTSLHSTESPDHVIVEAAEDVYVTGIIHKKDVFTASVVFDRIAKANSLNSKLMTDLTLTLQALEFLPGLAAVDFGSTNGTPTRDVAHRKMVFCGGADVVEMSQLDTPDQAEKFIRTVSGLCSAIRNLSVPVIAVVDGPCIGAGLEVAAACDLRYATQVAKFSMPEALLGIPSVVEARLLCDIIGWGRARALMLLGETWDAQEALNAGLIDKLFDTPKSMHGSIRQLRDIMGHKGYVYKFQKKLMRKWETCSIDQGIEAGVDAFVEVWRHEEPKRTAKNAIANVLAKRSRAKSLEYRLGKTSQDAAPPENPKD